LVDAETVANRDALALTCTLNSEVVQQSDSSDLIFSIPQLVAYLSGIVELYPGDVIFTGTPSGVGGARTPPRFLTSGDVLVSTIDGVGSITNRCV
jgi:2-keto-4-pentenoate hydratase/2-oxohepta-3-ene-1,7-dioic acid hydratase in catechol pathway